MAGADEVRPVRPGCTLASATVAGDAAMGGVLMQVRSAAEAAGTGAAAGQCYPVDGHPSLVRYRAAGRTVTLLGSGVPLTNAALAQRGNAALALNLLRGSPRLVWLVPSPPAVTAAGQKSLFQEIPGPAYLVTVQLFVAAGLAALWRTRRLGPLVAEPLPVVVRASETVEGHGRLIPVPAVPRPGRRGAARRGPAPDHRPARAAGRRGRRRGVRRGGRADRTRARRGHGHPVRAGPPRRRGARRAGARY